MNLVEFLLGPATVTGEGKFQALVYDILPLEEGAGKRCAKCGEEGLVGGGRWGDGGEMVERGGEG